MDVSQSAGNILECNSIAHPTVRFPSHCVPRRPVVTPDEIEKLQRHAQALEEEIARLKANDGEERRRTEQALALSQERYQTLFDSMDEGFCIIEFIDGPHGPLSDYIHIEANAAYARHAGIPNVVGQKVREMVPNEADGW
jgi:PAS domain-containing protein